MRFSREHTGMSTLRASIPILIVGVVILFGRGTEAWADPTPTAAADEAIAYTWNGTVTSGNLGNGAVRLGDIDGDGNTDFAVTQQQAAGRGAVVLFGPANKAHSVDLANLDAAEGYRVRLPSGTPPGNGLFEVGDQNGDGVTDFIIALNTGALNVVYGVSDPTELAYCDGVGTSPTRCLDTADPRTTSGDRMGFQIAWAGKSISVGLAGAADVDRTSGKEIFLAPIAVTPDGPVIEMFVLRSGLGDRCDATPGVCVIDGDELSAPDAVQIKPPSGRDFGTVTNMKNVGDLNGDGKEDFGFWLATDGAVPPSAVVLYGDDWDQNEVTIDSNSNALMLDAPFDAATMTPFRVGDVDGDGKDDVAFAWESLLSPPSMTVWTGDRPAGGANLSDPTPEFGLRYEAAEADWGVSPSNSKIAPLGDINGDGAGEFAIGDAGLSVGGVSNGGAVRIVFGHSQSPSDVIPLGSESPIDDVLTIAGGTVNNRFGSDVTAADDFDNDGIPDLFVTSRTAEGNRGSASVLTSSALVGRVVTGLASQAETESVALGGTVRSNGRDSVVYFEYGPSSHYGNDTGAQEVRGSNGISPVEAEVTGLTPDTLYHYRAVIENDLGVKAYGNDRTFKTKAVEIPRCEADPNAAGCPGYNGAKFCEQNPADPVCQHQEDPKVARLSNLIIGQKTLRVKRGKRGTVGLTIVNTGNTAARGIRLCVTGPKRFVAVQKCKRIGNLPAGKVATRAFKVKVKRRARKGKVIALKLTASANRLGAKTARVKVRVR